MYAINTVTEETAATAADLLARFYHEEGFNTPIALIEKNSRLLAADPHHWVALARGDGRHVGVVTVTTALYVEWGRLGEIGDLYVMPEWRRRGVASALIGAATIQCAKLGCSALSVVVTSLGKDRHNLLEFYEGRGFTSDGRIIMTRSLAMSE